MLTDLFNTTKFVENSVSCFTAAHYPSNFFKLFLSFLKKQHNIEFTSVFINSAADWQTCRLLLEMSFLGQSSYYWLHELGTEAKSRQSIYRYLASYVGPHKIFIFVNNEDPLPVAFDVNICLELKNNKEITNLVKLLAGVNSLRILNFIKKAQAKLAGQLTLDQLCILMQYGALVRDLDDFDDKWLHQVIESEQSLFELSKHFLFRDSMAFYKFWEHVAGLYSYQFWIAFFSEQLFRAHWFVIYQKNLDHRSARQIGFRLPFDFMKLGWRYIDPNLLKEAHNFLYQVDYQFKHGASEVWLDVFLNKFFKGSFTE